MTLDTMPGVLVKSWVYQRITKMWTCTEYTHDYDLKGRAKKDILFWAFDSNRKVQEVKVPKGFIPVFKIGKA